MNYLPIDCYYHTESRELKQNIQAIRNVLVLARTGECGYIYRLECQRTGLPSSDTGDGTLPVTESFQPVQMRNGRVKD